MPVGSVSSATDTDELPTEICDRILQPLCHTKLKWSDKLITSQNRLCRNIKIKISAEDCNCSGVSKEENYMNKDRPTDVTCFIFCSTCFEC